MNTFSGRIFFGIEIQNIWDPLGTSFKLCFYLAILFYKQVQLKTLKFRGDDGFIIFWDGVYDYLELFGKKNRRLCFLNASLVYWRGNWNEISLRPFLEIMFFGHMVFWSLISDSIEWAHDSRFCGEKIG